MVACVNHAEAHLSPELFDNGAGSAVGCPCDCCQAVREAAECAVCACLGCSEGNCCDHELPPAA